jgi:hydrophobic/amphiphilic exporter-1 (mainly G- bacteria), HAE1 family
MSITELSIKRPTLVAVIFAILSIAGILSYTMLKYDLLPKMDVPVVMVSTVYSGASATDVESSVTKKLEDALSSLENVDNMSSTSQEGISMIVITLNSGTDVDISLQEAQRKVNSVLSELPANAKTPSLVKYSTEDIPVLQLGVTAKIPETKLYQLTKDQIKSQISKINGVGQVTLVGGTEREIRINIDKQKLDGYKISIAAVYAAMANANLELPTGKIENQESQYTVRLGGKIQSVEELQDVTVARTANGGIVHLSDVADVYDGTAEVTTINRINNENSIGIIIQKQSDANTVDVCQKVKEELTTLENLYTEQGVKFNIASDTSIHTLDSANAVVKDLLLAIILVAFVMFFFLHSVRSSLIVMVSIPASIVSVFAAMYIFDFSLNLMTLLALSLVIGILVDDSIVVLENIHRHMDMGKNRIRAAVDGRSEIGFTAVAITMVDVVVFVPMALVTGMIGNMLREFSLVIVFSTLMSLFVSFTLTPLLASRFSKKEKLSKKSIMGRLALGFEHYFHIVIHFYERILKWGLGHRKTVYGIILLVFVGAVSLFPLGFIGMEFMPTSDKGEVTVKLETDQQNSLYQTNLLTQEVEKLLFSKPEVVKVSSRVGYTSSSSMSGSNEADKSELTVKLVDKKERDMSTLQYSTMLQNEIMKIPGVRATVSSASTMGSSNDAPIQVLLRGTNMNTLYTEADSVMRLIKAIPGTINVKLSVDKSKPEMRIALDRDKMAQLGLSVFDVANTLRLAFAGNSDLQFSEKAEEYDINLRFDENNRKNPEDIKVLTFLNNKGQSIELQNFATIDQTLGPNKLERYDRISSLTVKAGVAGRPTGTVGSEIKEAIQANIHNPEVEFKYLGQMEQQSDAFSSLGIAILLALVLVYLVMVALYNSYLYPFVVLFSIPMAVIGAFLALALTGSLMNMFAMIGMIMLIGLVAKNAILIVDFTNQQRAKGMGVFEALVEAGKERLRPILMTTLSMIFGMLPIALATGASSETKNGLAWVIIGGLTSSLLLTLILVPSVYMTMEKWKEKLNRKFGKKKGNLAEDIEETEAIEAIGATEEI